MPTAIPTPEEIREGEAAVKAAEKALDEARERLARMRARSHGSRPGL